MSQLVAFFLMVVAPGLAIILALLGLETLGENILGWFLLALGIAYPAGAVIFYFIRGGPFWISSSGTKTMGEETGDRSFWLILPGFLVVFYASPLELIYLPEILPRWLGMQFSGLALIVLAVVIRGWMRIHIKGLYSGHVAVSVDHRLVQSGPYRYIRHPGYLGFLLMALGLTVGYSSLIGLLAIPFLLLPGLGYRMSVEEKLLTLRFGEEYRAYAGRTKKLLPGIW